MNGRAAYQGTEWNLGRRRAPVTVAASWQRQSWALRILRAFLGVTFGYAGLQKLADPNFLHAGTPDFIGSQLAEFARGSPIRPLLTLLDRLPALTGLGIALLEIAVGLATLLGVAAISAAVVGLSINLILFLSATWHVHPYFLGSDSIYAVAWAAYVTGLAEVERRAARAIVSHGTRRERAAALERGIGRREFLRGAVVGIGTLVLGVFATAIAAQSSTATFPSPLTRKTGNRSAGSSQAQAPPRGTEIASLDSLPVGEAVAFIDPAAGPAVCVRLSKNDVVAFSRTCTHAGCPVDYDPSARLLVCPCHGAEFDPAHGAQVVAGPAPTPLAPIRVAIDRTRGTVIAET